jgi:lambda repressor-like predicted transcriptional regulator
MAKRSKAASSETTNGSGSAKETKADLIRAAAKEIGKPVRPRDIVAALKTKGVTVGYTQIAKALQAGGFHRKRGRRKGAAAASGAANGAAHSGKVNKAQRIRDAAKALGKKVRPKDIIAELAKDGIHVSSAQVSTTLSAAGYRRRKTGAGAGGGKSAAGKSAGHGLDLEALIATKALIQKVGGIEAAEEAIRALKRLA